MEVVHSSETSWSLHSQGKFGYSVSLPAGWWRTSAYRVPLFRRTWPTCVWGYACSDILLFFGDYPIVVGIETGYELDDREVCVWIPVVSRIFHSPRCPERLWVHPASYKMGTGAVSSFRVNRPGHEADYLKLVPRSRKYGSVRSLPHTPQLVKHRDTLTFIQR
jgi:hypothetical protein